MPGSNDISLPQSNREGLSSPPQPDARISNILPAAKVAASLFLGTSVPANANANSAKANDINLVARQSNLAPIPPNLIQPAAHDYSLPQLSAMLDLLANATVNPTEAEVNFLHGLPNAVIAQAKLEPEAENAFILSFCSSELQGTAQNLPAAFSKQRTLSLFADQEQIGQIGYQLDASCCRHKSSRYDEGKIQVSSLFFVSDTGRVKIDFSPSITILAFNSHAPKIIDGDQNNGVRTFGFSHKQGFYATGHKMFVDLSGVLQRCKAKEISITYTDQNGRAETGTFEQAKQFCQLVQDKFSNAMEFKSEAIEIQSRTYSSGQFGSCDEHDYAAEIESNTALGFGYSPGIQRQHDTMLVPRDAGYINAAILRL